MFSTLKNELVLGKLAFHKDLCLWIRKLVRVRDRLMENQNVSRIKITAVLFGVLVSSFGVLAFELSLTRIFSIMLDYHYLSLIHI